MTQIDGQRLISVIQASPAHTGSTLLVNLVHGFLRPYDPIHFSNKELKRDKLITKTHNLDIEAWQDRHPAHDLYFVMSERHDQKIKRLLSDDYKRRDNVIVINYTDLLEADDNSKDEIIDRLYEALSTFLPDELIPNKSSESIKNDMKNRFIVVNETVEKMKSQPFAKWDKFTGIHGSHRGR